jgi:hypothetical protein
MVVMVVTVLAVMVELVMAAMEDRLLVVTAALAMVVTAGIYQAALAALAAQVVLVARQPVRTQVRSMFQIRHRGRIHLLFSG